MKERGKFIVIEGGGGAGKSTQVRLAKEYLELEHGRRVVLTREPGGTPEAEAIRQLLFKLKGLKAANPDHQVALVFAARDFSVKRIVTPNIDNGIDVVSDRSYPSTAAFQGYGEGADLASIERMVEIIMGKYKPDAIILLDVNSKTARSRNQEENDPFDSESKDFFERVFEGYRDLARKNWSGVPWFVVNGEGSIGQVSEDVRQILDKIVLGGTSL